MIKRIITTVIGLPVLFIILHLGNPYLLPALFIVTVLGLNEFYDASASIGIRPISWAGYLITVIYYYLLFIGVSIPGGIALTVLLVIISLSFQVFHKNPHSIQDISFTLFAVVYVVFTISHLVLIDQLTTKNLIWLVFIIAWSCDTFAYLTGLTIGKHKLCPSVSPKKTVEGAIGGVFGSVIGCVIFSWFIMPNYIVLNAIMGFGGAILSQFGDLSASSVKRYFGIKDFGNLFPGHGGILDRFDSILFTAPYVFYYLQWINQIN
ncbi:MAG: phosphatidate cytidylyltransferase [Tindallia sp. MSAO_Bac2]|nr:MAG: phosphatidate cytidylyltransferase [Tindallia sp. MSAO_Bac2]